MARGFRYYGKKRGHRRTGSPAWGSVGEALFFAAFLLLGCIGTVVMLSRLVVPEWRVNHEFVETACKVLDKRIGEKPGEDGPLYRPEIEIRYDVGDKQYRGWHYDIHQAYSNGRENAQAVLNRFETDSADRHPRYPCWYDPANPDMVVLVRGEPWWVWLVATVPVSFVILGAGGLVYTLLRWGKSAERRAAMAQRPPEADLFRGDGNADPVYPFVPQVADMTNSPGTRLKFRLPMGTSPGWALFGTLAFALIWNGIVAVFAVIAVRKHLAGRPDWFLTIFILTFALIGLGAIVVFLRRMLVATGIGPTLMEISDHPLQPGGEYRLFLSQAGRLTIRALRVFLTCEEAVTYRQGTNTRTETRQVLRQELFCRENFDIGGGLPFEAEFALSLPAGIMHSFKADHNEINWSLAVEGEVVGWPDYKRCFQLVVRPGQGSVVG